MYINAGNKYHPYRQRFATLLSCIDFPARKIAKRNSTEERLGKFSMGSGSTLCLASANLSRVSFDGYRTLLETTARSLRTNTAIRSNRSLAQRVHSQYETCKVGTLEYARVTNLNVVTLRISMRQWR